MKTMLGAWPLGPMESACILIFLLAMCAEIVFDFRYKLALYETKSTIVNFLIGGFSLAFEFLMVAVSYPVLVWIERNFSICNLAHGYWYEWVLLFVVLDFLEYWFHRFSHEINLLWAAHVVHHQDKNFNFSVGFRTSFFVYFFNIFFYMVLPVIGFSVAHIMLIIFVQGMYQLLLHTKLIGNLGLLEYIFVTPSGHRVHRGCNEEYLDKNYGKVFIVWDLFFDTFQREKEPILFGVKDQIEYIKPASSLILPWKVLREDWKKEKRFYGKLKMLFRRPGR